MAEVAALDGQGRLQMRLCLLQGVTELHAWLGVRVRVRVGVGFRVGFRVRVGLD